MTNFYDLTYKDLTDALASVGAAKDVASWLFNWHYKQNKRVPLNNGRISKKDKALIAECFDFTLPEISLVQKSKDKTVKFLIKLKDDRTIETVLIPFQNKYTLCLSSQVGCAVKCPFCFTGTQGFTRHLKTHEILGQFLLAQEWLSENRPEDDRILNLVFMGQGEPLQNFEAVKKASEIFIDQHGLSLAPSKITLSTSGFLPGLKRWKKEMPNINIALSLHSPFDDERNELIPLNKKYPLQDVLEVIKEIPEGKNRFVTYEYLLMEGKNDTPAHAQALGNLLEGTKAWINLIPFNPIPGSTYQRPRQETLEAFHSSLSHYGLPITLRTTKGDDIMAACGQLKTQ